MINITVDSVTRGLRALVEEKGEDFVYQERQLTADSASRCVYVHDGKPDCIVGQFLAAQGIPLERLEKADEACFNSGAPAAMLLGQLEDENLVQAESRAVEILRVAQSLQDLGRPWGAAVEAALTN